MGSYADVVAAVLAEAGIEYVFGVPGSLSSVELIEAAARRGIRYVLCSNESSAAVMAGTYGVLRNRPGVVSTGVGPGAAAAVHGVAHCFLERAPCLVLTDRYGDADFARLSRQRLRQDALYRPITKGSFKLTTDAAGTVRRALGLAMADRPGPVHVDLPYDVMLATAPDNAIGRPPAPAAGWSAWPADEARAAALALIEKARRPAVIVGLQVNREGEAAEDAFTAFAERLGAPVFASLAAKGTLPEQHPLAAGTFRGVASERALLDQADMLIVVGFDPVEIFAPGGWPYPQPVVRIDTVTVANRERVFKPAVDVVAELAPTLRALADATPSRSWNREDIDAYRQGREHLLHPEGAGLMPGAVIRLGRERLPDGGILTVDAGQHKVLASDLWQARRRRGFLTSSGLGTMAVALPAAIVAQLVEPETPVLCFTGDGGMLMRLGDLETAAREGLPIVVVVFNDGWLNLIKIQQDNRRYERRGTQFGDVDYVAVARGLGFEARSVDSEAALDEALTSAFASGRAWLIDARINPDGYVSP
jgi:acetolactate synthase-1/2/3 large subunit